MTPDEVVANLVQECQEDHVGLWRVVKAAQSDLGAKNPNETLALSLDLVRTLLGSRGILVGHPTSDGRHFIPWQVPPDQALRRIEREWNGLGREPTIGDVAWFTTAE